MGLKEARDRTPASDYRPAVAGLHIEPDRRLDGRGRRRRRRRRRGHVMEPPQQAVQALAVIRQQRLGPLLKEAIGVRIQRQSVQKHVDGARLTRCFGRLEHHIPSAPVAPRTPQQILGHEPKRIDPHRMGGERRPVVELLGLFL
ncbi:hypothetical protein D3C86_601350 [compost metagenome]